MISHLPDIRVAALTAGSGVERMVQQCRRFHPELAVMATQEAAMQLETELNDASIAIAWGEEGLIRAATLENADCVIALEKPKFIPYRQKVIESIATILEVQSDQIFVKAKTGEKMGKIGRSEAIEVWATCLLSK